MRQALSGGAACAERVVAGMGRTTPGTGVQFPPAHERITGWSAVFEIEMDRLLGAQPLTLPAGRAERGVEGEPLRDGAGDQAERAGGAGACAYAVARTAMVQSDGRQQLGMNTASMALRAAVQRFQTQGVFGLYVSGTTDRRDARVVGLGRGESGGGVETLGEAAKEVAPAQAFRLGRAGKLGRTQFGGEWLGDDTG